MFGQLNIKVIGISLSVVAVFLAGWFTNGWRWDSKYTALVNKYQQAQIDAEQKSRKKEQEVQAAFDKERDKKNAEIRNIRRDLDAALVELRNRPARATVSNATSNGSGATGAQLYREDAEFLTREAARADEIMAHLKACYASYEKARQELNKN